MTSVRPAPRRYRQSRERYAPGNRVRLLRDGTEAFPAMLEAIETHRPAVIFLAYPNNPTGNLFSRADIERKLAAAEERWLQASDALERAENGSEIPDRAAAKS